MRILLVHILFLIDAAINVDDPLVAGPFPASEGGVAALLLAPLRLQKATFDGLAMVGSGHRGSFFFQYPNLWLIYC